MMSRWGRSHLLESTMERGSGDPQRLPDAVSIGLSLVMERWANASCVGPVSFHGWAPNRPLAGTAASPAGVARE